MAIRGLFRNKQVFYIFLIWLCLFLYLFNSLWLKQHSEGGLWYLSVCYFSDFLAPVVMLSITGLCLSFSGKAVKKLWQIMLLTLAFGLFWEFGSFLVEAAGFSLKAAVFDAFDFVAYAAGGFLFWIINRI